MRFIKFLAMLAIVLTSMTSCYTRIDSAYTGLKVDKYGDDKGEVNVVSVRGTVWYNPWFTDIFEYPNFVQRVDYPPFSVNTQDGSTIMVDAVLSYRIMADRTADIFKKYRKDVEGIQNSYIATAVYDAYRHSANTYTVDKLMSSRTEFEAKVQEMLTKSLTNEGFYLEQITGKIDPPQSLKNAIDSKNEMIQEAMKAENRVKQAEAEAKIKVAQAEGDARAIKIKADAEAYANAKVASSITTTLVEMRRVEAWDGKYPTTMAGSGTGLLINSK